MKPNQKRGVKKYLILRMQHQLLLAECGRRNFKTKLNLPEWTPKAWVIQMVEDYKIWKVLSSTYALGPQRRWPIAQTL